MSATQSGPRHLTIPLCKPVISQNETAVIVEAYTSQAVAACEIATAKEAALVITDKKTLAEANALVVDLAQAEKVIEARAKELKTPWQRSIDAIQEMKAGLLATIVPAKKSLQSKLMAFKRQEDERIAKEKAEAEAELRKAREAAEAERKRLQDIADAEHKAKVEVEQARAQQEAKELAEVLGEPVEAAPVVIAPAPVVTMPEIPVSTRTLMHEKAVEIAVSTRKDKKLEITDLRALCRYIADGGSLDLVNPNTVAIKNALASGAQIPGCKMIEVETNVQKRGGM